MNSDGIVYDLNEIGQVLPEPFIQLVLGKVNVLEPLSESGYKNLPVVRNRSAWLWKAFIKFIMPFQMKTTRKGKRRQSVAGFLYMMFMFMWMPIIFIETGLIKYPLYLAWTYVIGRALLPYITAVIKLVVNKNYYAPVHGRQ